MPGISNAEFWNNIFFKTKEMFRQMFDNLPAESSGPEQALKKIEAEQKLTKVINAQGQVCQNAQAFSAYLLQIQKAVEDPEFFISQYCKTTMLAQIEAIRRSFVQKSIPKKSSSSSSRQQLATRPVVGSPLQKNLLEAWENTLLTDSVNTTRRALKSIVSRSFAQSVVKPSEEQDFLSQGVINNRCVVREKLSTVFSAERDVVAAQKYVSVVSNTLNFNQRLDALIRVVGSLQDKRKSEAQQVAWNSLADIRWELEREIKSSSAEALDNLYQTKQEQIERELSVLYGLPEASDQTFSAKVQKKYAWWPSLFASEERKAIEQYVAADPAVVRPGNERAQAKKDFDQAFARSTAEVADKSVFHAALTALENHSSSEATEIAKTADAAYREDILRALDECYTSATEITGQDQSGTVRQPVNAHSVPSADDIRRKVKNACGWSFSAWWSGEYKKADAFLKVLHGVPVDKENIKKLSTELSRVLASKKTAPSDTALATLDASVKSDWSERLTATVRAQEKDIAKRNEQFSHARDHYRIEDSPGYPAEIAETHNDCDYFISEIFSKLNRNGIRFHDEAEALYSADTQIQNLIESLKGIYRAATQNQYFVVTLLSLELVVNKGAAYQKELKELLLILLGKQKGQYANALMALKKAGAPNLLTNYLPKDLTLVAVMSEAKEAIHNAINSLAPWEEPKKSSVASSPATTTASSNGSVVSTTPEAVGPRNNKSADQINGMTRDEFLKYAKECAKEIIASRNPMTNFYQPFQDLLAENLKTSTCSNSIVLTYTLWQWYQAKTPNGKEIFREHETKRDAWAQLLTPVNEFTSTLKSAFLSAAPFSNRFFPLPEKGTKDNPNKDYPYSGESLQKLVNITKAILPQNCDSNFADNSTETVSTGSGHSVDSITESRLGYFDHSRNKHSEVGARKLVPEFM